MKNGVIQPPPKPVEAFINGEWVQFASGCEAERETGVHKGNISSACKGKVKTAGGYKWRLKNTV